MAYLVAIHYEGEIEVYENKKWLSLEQIKKEWLESNPSVNPDDVIVEPCR